MVESENFKILWISQSSVIGNLRQEREVVIIDVAIEGDDRMKDKELEKLEKY